MKRTARAALAALVLAAPLSGGAQAQITLEEPSITITGTGEVSAVPDMARLQLGVVARAASADQALAEMGRSMEKVLAELDRQGVEPSRIQTQSLGLTPIRNTSQAARAQGIEIEGFEARSRVEAEIVDLDRLGEVIDKLVRAGANDLSGLSFGLQNFDAKRDEARKAALQDAMATARLYAEAAGVTLGGVLSISEQGATPRPEMMSRALAADAGVPIAQGEVSVTARVTLVIALEN